MDPREKNKADVADCVMSLAVAIEEAGGSVKTDQLLDMTVREFIANVAGQNNIRFHHRPDVARRDEVQEAP